MIVLQSLICLLVIMASYVALYGFYIIRDAHYNNCIRIETRKENYSYIKSLIDRRRSMRCKFVTMAYALTAGWVVALVVCASCFNK